MSPEIPARIGRFVIAVAACAVLALVPGCLVVQVGATNPTRGINTVAVVPFFNQSDERVVDGRQLASLYGSELQKIPGVEVIPVGVVETTMREQEMTDLTGPRDVARLALLLNVDAVVIGSVTEYSPYQPPRLGLSVAWYTPYGVQFDPGVAVDDHARDAIHRDLNQRRKAKFEHHKQQTIQAIEQRLDRFFLFESDPALRYALPDANARLYVPEASPSKTPSGQPANKSKPPKVPPAPPSNREGPPKPKAKPQLEPVQQQTESRFRPPVIIRSQSPEGRPPRVLFPVKQAAAATPAAIPIRPLMTYTKVFDAADSNTSAAFRDFLEVSGDPRQGSWSARLQWADEFHRFVMHTMIVEMFELHGGEARRRIILKWRKFK